MEKVHKFYSEDLRIRASVAYSTNVIQEICNLQTLFPLASMALGRLVTGTLLMASQQSENQRIGVRVNGDGALGELFAESSFECEVRGYCENTKADPPRKSGHLDLQAGVGKGLLAVSRSLPFQKQPHLGIVPIVSGEIAEDLAFYLHQSHQIQSIMALAVALKPDGKIAAAGGVLIELMPGAPDSFIVGLEKKASEATPLSQRLLAKESPETILKAYAHDSDLVEVEHPHPIKFFCRCSLDRVQRTLLLLGKAALAEMALKGEAVPVKCEFCHKDFLVPIETIRELAHSTSSSVAPDTHHS